MLSASTLEGYCTVVHFFSTLSEQCQITVHSCWLDRDHLTGATSFFMHTVENVFSSKEKSEASILAMWLHFAMVSFQLVPIDTALLRPYQLAAMHFQGQKL